MIRPFSRNTPVPVEFHECYGETLQRWLPMQLEGFATPEAGVIAIDVGAYKGDFFDLMIRGGIIDRAYLFEPNPGNASGLRERFPMDSVIVEELAVGERSGSIDFHLEAESDGSTGSILRRMPDHQYKTESVNVRVVTLDHYASESNIMDKISVLKIDAQGSDLSVLRGGSGLLEQSQPLVVAELMFRKSYENQCSPYELMDWMCRQGYQLAGFFDEHFSSEGWLAWCDACFLPVKMMPDYSAPYAIRSRPRSENPHGSEKVSGGEDSKKRKRFFGKLIKQN
jgi:FkbM family methyltransferase